MHSVDMRALAKLAEGLRALGVVMATGTERLASAVRKRLRIGSCTWFACVGRHSCTEFYHTLTPAPGKKKNEVRDIMAAAMPKNGVCALLGGSYCGALAELPACRTC
jgi:hypothetical protein